MTILELETMVHNWRDETIESKRHFFGVEDQVIQAHVAKQASIFKVVNAVKGQG